ncbi:MAG TPA: DUF4190 domain-containing protein [Candidatus Dormibacteraeota bacterium]|nr:DUF4190 domain-containing protein [Candidatus Dormibacteraeota bacterium]
MTRDRSATRALVFGLLSLLFGVFAPLAIWSGARALYRIRTGPGNLTGEGAALVGLVAGFVALVLALLGIVFWLLGS